MLIFVAFSLISEYKSLSNCDREFCPHEDGTFVLKERIFMKIGDIPSEKSIFPQSAEFRLTRTNGPQDCLRTIAKADFFKQC